MPCVTDTAGNPIDGPVPWCPYCTPTTGGHAWDCPYSQEPWVYSLGTAAAIAAAEEDIAAGRVKAFDNVDELIQELRS